MTINFLCPIHRDWVYFHPQEALTYIEEAQQQGEILLEKQDWQEATAFLGCAFETTTILMELQGVGRSYMLSRLTSLAILLANSFNKLSANYNSTAILEQAKRLLHLATDDSLDNKPKFAYIKECLFAISASQGKSNQRVPLDQIAASKQMH
ncbi:MAG: hypothetical protein ABJH06_18765 [Paraglaciecola sp.]|uniref:hypothetical protein n=1 Tax=Paraglaciecola sp. TaxID=1920173 RepID=UPI0032995099